VNPDKCTGCGECVEVCSIDAISMQTVASIDATECILCGACVFTCPDQAIEMPY
jgi:ferredoxin